MINQHIIYYNLYRHKLLIYNKDKDLFDNRALDQEENIVINLTEKKVQKDKSNKSSMKTTVRYDFSIKTYYSCNTRSGKKESMSFNLGASFVA